jgi:hypothetical protein
MKHFAHVILFIALLPAGMDAQLNPISARELVSNVISRAKTDLASDAYLQSVLFAGGTQQGITLSFDLTSGKANAWIYAIYSPSRDSVLYYAGVNVPLFGYQVIAAPSGATIPTLPFGHGELSEPFIDSPAALQAAKGGGADAFLQSHPNAKMEIAAALRLMDDLPTLPAGKYWLFRFVDGSAAYFCYVSAETGSPVQCGTVTSAESMPQFPSLSMSPLAPQPLRLSLSRQAVLQIELPVAESIRLAVHDELGREIAVIRDGVHPAGVHHISFDADCFARPGMYYVTLTRMEGSITRKALVTW